MARDVATFRGVPFFVGRAELAGGRKTATFEYPFRDDAFVEDLGRRARGFQIDGYVLGANFEADQQALIDALEQPGPGTLVHPYFGTRLVAVSKYQATRTKDEYWTAEFSIDLVETVATAFSPAIAGVPVAQVGTSADAAHYASRRGLLASWRTTVPFSGAPGLLGAGATKKLPQFTLTSLARVVTSYSTALHAALKPVVIGADNLSSLKRSIDALVLDATGLVRDPASLASRFADLFKSLVTLPATPRLGVSALLEAYRFTSSTPRPPATTLTRQYEAVNYDAVDRFLRTGTVLEAGRLVAIAADTAGSFDSYEDAIAVRGQVLDALDEQAEAATQDEVFDALTQVRTDVASAVPSSSAALPHLVTVTAPETVPSLVLAYRLYGSDALADDLVARNRVRHPGFVIGGRPLEVLSRG